MKALRTPCQPPASSTLTESCCRCALSCMMCGAPSSSRHTAPRWCAWRCHWMASCLPQPQSGARLCVYTPQQTPPSCRCVAMQAQEPMALFRCSCWADVGQIHCTAGAGLVPPLGSRLGGQRSALLGAAWRVAAHYITGTADASQQQLCVISCAYTALWVLAVHRCFR